MTYARQSAEIIHLQGMKKGLSQLMSVIEQQIGKIDSRISELKVEDADE